MDDSDVYLHLWDELRQLKYHTAVKMRKRMTYMKVTPSRRIIECHDVQLEHIVVKLLDDSLGI